ncbi:MAG: DoxX family protein [Ignavibacteria bacterium]|nr:DoxX family protein [Ignavibacteria bacterium]
MKNKLKQILNNPFLSLAARLTVGIVFIYASVSKIADPHQFAKEISNYNIMLDSSLNLMALALPWIELIAGLFLIAGVRLRANSAIIGILLIVFIIAVGLAVAQGLDINCGCFSKMASERVGLKKIFENSGMLLLCIYIFRYPVPNLTLERLYDKEETDNEEEITNY